jgi:hypothetical protein
MQEADKYLAKHTASLNGALTDAVDAAIRTRAADPIQFTADQLSAKSATAPARRRRPAPCADEGLEEWSTVGWLSSLPLAAVLGTALSRKAETSSELEYVRSLRLPELRALLSEGPLLDALAIALADGTEALRTAVAASGSELNAKFAADGAGAMSYGEVAGFYDGLESLIGPPNPKLRSTMEAEHCNAADSDHHFTSNNYDLTTCPRYEWWQVVDPVKGLTELGISEYPQETRVGGGPRSGENEHKCRKQRPLSDFDGERERFNAELKAKDLDPLLIEELIGGRIYTGPMFMRYNLAMRAKSLPKIFAKWWEEECKGNGYVTTLHVINSAHS